MRDRTRLIDLEPYEACCIAGVILQLRIEPNLGCIEVLVGDGTGEARARWSVCRPTPQLAAAPGREIVLEGVTTLDPDGTISLEEPSFAVVDVASVARPDTDG